MHERVPLSCRVVSCVFVFFFGGGRVCGWTDRPAPHTHTHSPLTPPTNPQINK